ncbi:hypothetical protein F5Y16DRAFT_385398 [Xylariaceae sp. FL0255]|nr:hypothetical protein F5Y16DRAFT_385398 [Xylariaceae sp. FL0255]
MIPAGRKRQHFFAQRQITAFVIFAHSNPSFHSIPHPYSYLSKLISKLLRDQRSETFPTGSFAATYSRCSCILALISRGGAGNKNCLAFARLSHAMAQPTPEKDSLLLRMPAEIRNHIYELVVWSEWKNTSPSYFVLDRPLPSLFRTNRQVRSEALDVFLLKNRFHIYTTKIGFKWLNLLGKDANRFRFLDIFIDLQLFEWSKYIKALVPLVSDNIEIRIRKAAASLNSELLDDLLQRCGFLDTERWTMDMEQGVFVFRRAIKTTDM